MLEIESFMKGLDALYQRGQPEQAEVYLLNGLRQTEDKKAALVILNELIGYYRAVSRHEDCTRCVARALDLVRELGLEGTLDHATTLLNIATGFRAAGKYQQAEQDYLQALRIFEQQLPGPDARLTTLHNNLGHLYAQTGRPQQAKEHMLEAIRLAQQLPNMDIKKATTYTNLGNLCFSLHQPQEAADYLRKAVELFEQNPADPHYPAALSGLGEASFYGGDLKGAAEYYEKALVWIEKFYGQNDDWKTTKRNLETVQDLLRRKETMAQQGMKGMDLSRAYYEEVGKPMLRAKYPQYIDRIAVGLAGEGSECLGFDDSYSTDHDFGPGFCMWLTAQDYAAIGQALQADYEALPKQWRGFPVRNTTAEGAGRVGVWNMDDFFRKFTGYAQAPEVKTLRDVALWNQIPPEMLCTAVNGQVFEDSLGEFTHRRAAFSAYPEPVRLYRLADVLHTMAQAGQYNYGRGKSRGDLGMMYSALAEFIKAAAEAGYLLNRSYMPFYKWRIRGMESFTHATQLKEMLEQLMSRKADASDVAEKIETVCDCVIGELRAQKLTISEGSFLEQQKQELLQRMQALLSGADSSAAMSDQARKKLADQIVELEWQQFQRVHNEGGRAACQENRETFEIMRKSQFYTWNKEVLESYLGDLQDAQRAGWNLVMEKYARMMEHTANSQYQAFAQELPRRSPVRMELQEVLVALMMRWTRSVEQQYPDFVSRGRKLSSAQDTARDTSSETYLRGELSTYSDRTIVLYAQMLLEAMERKENPVERNLANMVGFYGYDSLNSANKMSKMRRNVEENT